MSLAELIEVVPPSPEPVETDPSEAKHAVEALGVALPQDLYDFGLRYGSGMFGDAIRVYNPFGANYLACVRMVGDCYRDLKSAEGDEFIPYDIFPTSPGLLAWGDEVNGNVLFWLTQGEPNDWPIILFSRHDGSFERWDMPLTTFLAKVFKAEVDCVLGDREWLKANYTGIRIVPGEG
jgi:hypothetical protein